MAQRLSISRAELVAVASAFGLMDEPGAPPRQLWDRILRHVRPPPSAWYLDDAGVRRCVHCGLKRCLRQIGGSVLCQRDGRGEVATTEQRQVFERLVVPE